MESNPNLYSFPRYLAAKKSVDDRAINPRVWETLADALPPSGPQDPLLVLEVGAGIGTMLERMLDWGLLGHAYYTAVDLMEENIAAARESLSSRRRGEVGHLERAPGSLCLGGPDQEVVVRLEAVDLFDLVRRTRGTQAWDLIVAHAFLDLVDIPAALPQLFSLLRPGGLFYFTLNFDGLTLFEPALDPVFDEQIQALYHHTMDERLTGGKPSGDSRAGRRLFFHLRAAGAQILAAGASDWVVFPGQQGYPADEAFFLHFIIQTIHRALSGHPELDGRRFERWVAERHAQIERCELVYIAHQLDFVGKVRP